MLSFKLAFVISPPSLNTLNETQRSWERGCIQPSVGLRMAVTRMDTLKSGWTHSVYYTTHPFSSVFCLIL